MIAMEWKLAQILGEIEVNLGTIQPGMRAIFNAGAAEFEAISCGSILTTSRIHLLNNVWKRLKTRANFARLDSTSLLLAPTDYRANLQAISAVIPLLLKGEIRPARTPQWQPVPTGVVISRKSIREKKPGITPSTAR